jgi:hypothetical protein
VWFFQCSGGSIFRRRWKAPMDIEKLLAVSAHIDLVRFAKYWVALAAGRPMPHRQEFRPNDVAWMLGRVFLVDVLADVDDYRFRLFGSRMMQVYGGDLTSLRLNELTARAYQAAMRHDFDMVANAQAPLYRRGRLLWPDREHVGVEQLLVPLADNSGHVGTILGAECFNSLPAASVVIEGANPPRFDVQ